MTRLDRIKERLDAATPGPWRRRDTAMVNGTSYGVRIGYYTAVVTQPDAALIAHAPADLRDLVAVAEAAKALDLDDIHEFDCSHLALRGGPECNCGYPVLRAALAALDAEET